MQYFQFLGRASKRRTKKSKRKNESEEESYLNKRKSESEEESMCDSEEACEEKLRITAKLRSKAVFSHVL